MALAHRMQREHPAVRSLVVAAILQAVTELVHGHFPKTRHSLSRSGIEAEKIVGADGAVEIAGMKPRQLRQRPVTHQVSHALVRIDQGGFRARDDTLRRTFDASSHLRLVAQRRGQIVGHQQDGQRCSRLNLRGLLSCGQRKPRRAGSGPVHRAACREPVAARHRGTVETRRGILLFNCCPAPSGKRGRRVRKSPSHPRCAQRSLAS